MKPVDASTIDNLIGTARGVHFKNKKFNLFALPGVPSEMKMMMENYVIKNLKLFFKPINVINKTINKTLSSVHIFSSARIGSNKKLCPINPNGEVPKFKNAFVMDSSTIPSCPTVNPQSTAVLFSLNLVRRLSLIHI